MASTTPTPNRNGRQGSSPRRSSQKKKPSLNPIVIVAIALVVFIATIGIAVSLLNSGDDNPEEETSSSIASGASSEEDEDDDPDDASSSEEASNESSSSSTEGESSSAASSASSSQASSSSSSASSSASSSSSSSSSAPASTGVFDPDSLGSSGYDNIAAYKKINADVKGWLRVPGTNINYPVLYSNDVMYYLNKNIYKQQDKNGVIWADPQARFGLADEIGKNTVLYGHNWTNVGGSYGEIRIGDARDVMFAQLPAYHYINFAKEHPYIYYSTEAEEMIWKVFAVFYTDIGFNYINGTPTDAELTNIINGAKSRSIHNFDVAVNSSDKILTLSTCTRVYGASEDQRFVVMARLLRSGEDTTAVTVTSNPNPVKPNL